MSLHRVLAAVVGFLLSLVAVESQAARHGDVYDFSIYQQYLSVRALGMGNAFTAVADDYNTLLYNPAGMARLEDPNIVLGIGANVDSKVMKLKNDIETASKSSNVNDMVNLLQSNYGNHYGLRAPTLSAFWVRPRKGFAFIPLDLNIDAQIHQLVGPALGIIATQDSTLAYGFGWNPSWGKDYWSLGVTVKAIHRVYYNKFIPAAELALNSNVMRSQDAKEGVTLDADFGMLWTPKVSESSWVNYLKPTLGFVARNVGDYGYLTNFHLVDKNSTSPPKLGRRFDLGSKFDLPDWWIFKTRGAADLRDIGHDNFTVGKGFHAGAEFLWKVKSWWQGGWRVGVSQGYFTAGFSGTMAMFTLDLATYADEVGPSDAPKASRRYVMKASLDW